MSDLFATILAMEKWTKYTYVCDPDECDSLIEFTCKDTFGFPSGSVTNITCPCGRKPQLLSVEDATILSTTDPKGQTMETMTDTFMQERINELTAQLANHQNCDYWKAENGRVQGQVIDLINSLVEEDMDQDEIVTTLSEIVDYQPKKEIEFTATIRFTGRMEIDALEYKDNFDLSDILGEAYVDINHGDVVIDGYELEDAEEC
jgi:hypothetical protein